jgi:hephaestin
MTMVTADMVADNPGVWLFHCHVNDHITAGMIARYQVIG